MMKLVQWLLRKTAPHSVSECFNPISLQTAWDKQRMLSWRQTNPQCIVFDDYKIYDLVNGLKNTIDSYMDAMYEIEYDVERYSVF